MISIDGTLWVRVHYDIWNRLTRSSHLFVLGIQNSVSAELRSGYAEFSSGYPELRSGYPEFRSRHAELYGQRMTAPTGTFLYREASIPRDLVGWNLYP